MLMGFQYSNLMQFDSLTFQQKILVDGFNGISYLSPTQNPCLFTFWFKASPVCVATVQ